MASAMSQDGILVQYGGVPLCGSLLKNMNKQSNSLTGGVLIIEMPGRGVSLLRASKSCPGKKDRKEMFKAMENQEWPSRPGKPTQMRRARFNRPEFESRQKKCHMIVKITDWLANEWGNKLLPDERRFTSAGTVVTPKYTKKQRFMHWLKDHAEALAIAANIKPESITFTFQST